ncbi:dTDP-4-dehydrorhamnose 3,5-epimerase family protein [Coraliomargarita parva]|uniref:dTDP-4-dehydrorhamnose 3,5-epimerase family protein n=1 Tax=Coraliomargarita parva TaxID=3014050 RepID=UPI0022B44DDB|nr:dTDP-4-dehydrorhamnose 3,5-epimerase family protein [Coraliomargarita parva]
MKFKELPIKDAWLVTMEPRGDARGFFARVFCRKELEAHGIIADVAQVNYSRSADAGTMRGLHYQKAPAEETKLFRCINGSVYDVMLDLRPDSPSYLQHFGIELKAGDLQMVFVPRGCAHGFMTLEPDSEVEYLVSEYYAGELEDGLRHDDPFFKINWPMEAKVISDKDRSWPLFSPQDSKSGA